MPLLLPIKWFVVQILAFLIMVAIEAGVLHYLEGISRRNSMVYMFIVNLFSFSFGWLLVTIAFYLLARATLQDDILSYMLLGILDEALLGNRSLNPLKNKLLIVMLVYFWAIFYFELKFLTLLRRIILPVEEFEEDELNLPIPVWLDRLLAVLLAKDLSLVVTVFIANFLSHVAVGALLYLAQ